MLAEDDTTMVTLLKTLLKMEGFEVIPVDADADVVQAVLKDCPDVLLMDVHLFNQNGIDILEKLRATQGITLRIVMTSGLDFKQQCLARGADAFIQKPYMPEDLMSALRGLNS